MAAYRILASGRVQAIVRKKGHSAQFKTFPNKRQATKWATDLELELEHGTYEEIEDMSLLDAIKSYEDEVAQHKKSYMKVEKYILQRLSDAFGHYLLSTLKPRTIQQWLDIQDKAPATLKRDRAVLSSVYEHLRTDLFMEIENVVKLTKIKGKMQSRDVIVSEEQYDVIGGFLTAPMRAIADVLLATGMRRTEALSIKPDWIEGELFRIPAHITKTGHERTFGISGDTRTKINNLFQYDMPMGDSVTKAWGRACKKAYELTGDKAYLDIHLHDLRHTALTELARKGLSTMQIASVSGHRELSMLNVYVQRAAVGSSVVV